MSVHSTSPVSQGDVQIIPMEDHRYKSWRGKDENDGEGERRQRVNGQVRGNQVDMDHHVRGFMYEQAGMEFTLLKMLLSKAARGRPEADRAKRL